MLKHYYRIIVVISGLHQTFEVGSVGWISDFDTLDGCQCTLYTANVIRTATTIGTNRHPDNIAHRIFTTAKIARFGYLCYQLIDTRIDIVGKLHLYDWFEPYCTHAHCRAYNIRLLYSSVEHPFVAKLLR